MQLGQHRWSFINNNTNQVNNPTNEETRDNPENTSNPHCSIVFRQTFYNTINTPDKIQHRNTKN